jgi:O-antigen/teichoic acid export membrane protein
MKKEKKKMLGKLLRNRLFKNISWIFFGNVMHSLLQFLLNIYVARKLSLSSNGVLNYSTALITFFTAIASLGYGSTITKEFSTKKEKIGEYLCSCILSSAAAGALCIAALLIIIRILNPGENQLYIVSLCQSTSIIFSSLNLFVYWYRYENKANVAAIMRLVAFFVSALWRVLVLSLQDPLVWYVCGTAAETLIFGVLMASFFLRYYKGRIKYSLATSIEAVKHSYPFIFAAVLMTVYSQADRVMLKAMINTEAVALYSVSAVLAGALSMIPSSLIEAFRPDIMEYKECNEYLYRKRFRQLYCVIFWASALYGLFVTVFAKQIILLLYGEKYIEAVSSLALIVWYSAFSYFGSVNNMYMVAEGKNKWVEVTTLVGAVGNIILNAALIPFMGIAGAALASLLTQILTNFLMMWLIPVLRPGFDLLLKGVTFQDIIPKKL